MNTTPSYKQISMADFDYPLTDDRIAKFPLAERDASKLLRYDHGTITSGVFREVPQILPSGTLLLFNNTKVIHARIFFRKSTGAVIEIFCLEPSAPAEYAQNFASVGTCTWHCIVGHFKRWKNDTELERTFDYNGQTCRLSATRGEPTAAGEVEVTFTWDGGAAFSELLEICGVIPIPPYLNRESEASDSIRYQTVYSKFEGSVAAPTAGLHFTQPLLEQLREKGITTAELTLHIGAGTFKPVKTETIGEHPMHTEHFSATLPLLEQFIRNEGHNIAVGTTSVRAIESLYWMGVKCLEGRADYNRLGQWECYDLPQNYTLKQSFEALIKAAKAESTDRIVAATTIIILPGYRFRTIQSMFTNFHQPHSTLLLLVAAAVGEDWHRIYDYALKNDFRFLSYGDSNLLQFG